MKLNNFQINDLEFVKMPFQSMIGKLDSSQVKVTKNHVVVSDLSQKNDF